MIDIFLNVLLGACFLTLSYLAVYFACSFRLFGWRAEFVVANNYKYSEAADLMLDSALNSCESAVLDEYYITLSCEDEKTKIWIANRWYAFANKVGMFNNIRVGVKSAGRLKKLMEQCAANNGKWQRGEAA